MRDGAEDLANKNGCWSLVEEAVGAVCGNQRHVSVAEVAPSRLLHDQVAGETACRLDDDGPDAVAEESLQHGGEAGPFVDVVGAGYGRVVKLLDNLIARAPGESPHCVSLALEAILVRPDIRC